MTTPTPVLDVRGLTVAFRTEHGRVRAVEDVSFALGPGEVLAVVGESGSGKSLTALTLMGLTRGPGTEIGGTATLAGLELLGAREEELRRVRGREIAMVFQDPMTALNPVLRVGAQIIEQIRAHEDVSEADARERAIDLLDRVGIPRAKEAADAWPHELSGGMRQRVLIAMAMSCEPAVLIADEPTTALDVTIQAQVLDELRALRDRAGTAIVLVTHDLGVVAALADRVAVMYAGRIVETGTLEEILADPQHPYTWGLLGSVPRIDGPPPARLPSIPGAPPSLADPPAGCRFRPRCPHAMEACLREPELVSRDPSRPGHLDRCWLEPPAKRTRRQLEPGRIGLVRGGAAA
jgi:oligopeptide/dipeptide ABC transporter ATP-binding protein